MKRTKGIYLAVLAALLSPMAANAEIIWDWSFDGESGQFATTGTGADLAGAASFDYIFGSFVVTSSAAAGVQVTNGNDPTAISYTGTASSPCCADNPG
mgnify:FL=1